MANIELYDHACARIKRALRDLNYPWEIRFQTDKQPEVITFVVLNGEGQVVGVSGDWPTGSILALSKKEIRRLVTQVLEKNDQSGISRFVAS